MAKPRPPAAARPVLRRVEAVVNPSAGSSGPNAKAEVEALLAAAGVDGRVTATAPRRLEATLRQAIDRGPDLLVVVAGDGTARTAASLCGADGPLVAPLAGGTMNMLPHALYGARPWQAALKEILESGVQAAVSGGEVDGKPFYVAAILGAPALWAKAREAMREGRLDVAVRRAGTAVRRAFSSQLTYSLDGRPPAEAEAITLMCPVCSRAMDNSEAALEADVLNPAGAAEAFRLGFRTLVSDIAGDWRQDPAVEVTKFRQGEAWASGTIPAILDGEPMRLHKRIPIRFVPTAFRALVPRDAPGAELPRAAS